MAFRIPDNISQRNFLSNAGTQQFRINKLQEQIVSGKRINRASDDPGGTEAIISLRTSQSEIDQFSRNADTAARKLTAADDTLSGYRNVLDRVRTLFAQGISDTTTDEARGFIAVEIDALRTSILRIANTEQNGEFIFGGTRQNTPPFDSSGTLSATPATFQFVQIEPGADAIAVGVTADTIFTDATENIFNDLTAASAALRGTGDPVADRTALQTAIDRVDVYTDLTTVAHSFVGVNTEITEIVKDRLVDTDISYSAQLSAIEDTDFVEAVFELSQARQSLEAIYQIAATSRRSLLDFLG